MSTLSPKGQLTRDEVAHLARLARLAVTDEELDVFAGQLGAVLDAVAEVGKADVADVPPTTHAVPMTNVLRPDVVRPSLPRDVILAEAPAAEDGRFRVPRILGEEA
jgi:aspartyl-tRNA(Asn)/glutamyl-tRNA(Gln) amidotransferase subunit C